MVCGLVFVPVEMLPEAIRQLRAYTFNPESKFYEQNLKFKDILLDTHDRVWMNGSFPPKMWNHANETTNLTNNDNEVYFCLHQELNLTLCFRVTMLISTRWQHPHIRIVFGFSIF